MLNKEKHQLIMGKILRDIYTDISIASFLGFKGGTCAYFFYGLTRFSVDLDFDLLDPSEDNKKLVFEKVKVIIEKYGTVKDGYIKRNTIFFVLSYGDHDHNIKIETSTRELRFNIKTQYELKEYLGISMLVAKKDYLFAGKLAALTLRTDTAPRDVFDIDFFAKNNWDINHEVVEAWTKKKTEDYMSDCIAVIEKIKDNQMLNGLGDLLDEKQKDWVRNHLKADVLFMLKNYQSVLK
jgi:predicted nucleotidyltransferase component of viral defense system